MENLHFSSTKAQSHGAEFAFITAWEQAGAWTGKLLPEWSKENTQMINLENQLTRRTNLSFMGWHKGSAAVTFCSPKTPVLPLAVLLMQRNFPHTRSVLPWKQQCLTKTTRPSLFSMGKHGLSILFSVYFQNKDERPVRVQNTCIILCANNRGDKWKTEKGKKKQVFYNCYQVLNMR